MICTTSLGKMLFAVEPLPPGAIVTRCPWSGCLRLYDEKVVRGRPLSPDSKRQRQKEKDEGIVADRRRKCGLTDEPN
jgi:hypothetical protein